MIVEHQGVAVELEDIGEGLSGDYDPSDPYDVALLRFTVLLNGEQVEDASYCTRIPADTDSITQATLAATILEQVIEEVLCGHSIKRLCEELSWIDERGRFGLEV